MMKTCKQLQLALLTIACLCCASGAMAATDPATVDIFFTHDVHANFYPITQYADDATPTSQLGGFARLKTVFDDARAVGDPLIVDGGDFSMGTLFSTIYASHALELRMMGKLGYDVTTLGNHEFDFRTSGLTEMLNAAKNSGEPLPQMVLTNYENPADGATPELMALRHAFSNYPVLPYTIVEKNGVKIGLFGILGIDADASAPTAALAFTDAAKAAKTAVQQLKNQEKVDLIVCLSHSGTNKKPSKSEDTLLAKAVPDIDVIISGHTHSALAKPLMVGKTAIVSAGEYGQYYGKLSMQAKQDRWEVASYAVVPVDDSIRPNDEVDALIQEYTKAVQSEYLSKYGYTFHQVLAELPYSTLTRDNLSEIQGESQLANLLTDSYINAIQQIEGDSYIPIAASIMPNGSIRGSFYPGKITVSDAFFVDSLGVGKDGLAGYPLLDLYLTGAELKTVCEIDASVSELMTSARLYISGMTYTINPHRVLLNRASNVMLMDRDGKTTPIDDKALYRVVGGLYSAQMLSAVTDVSFGLLKVVPKDENGKPVKDFESRLLYTQNGNELKEWTAVADYLNSFEKVEGVSVVPAYYNVLHNRKIMDNTKSLSLYFTGLNGYVYAMYAIVLVVLLLIVALVIFICVLVKRRKRNRAPKPAR